MSKTESKPNVFIPLSRPGPISKLRPDNLKDQGNQDGVDLTIDPEACIGLECIAGYVVISIIEQEIESSHYHRYEVISINGTSTDEKGNVDNNDDEYDGLLEARSYNFHKIASKTRAGRLRNLQRQQKRPCHICSGHRWGRLWVISRPPSKVTEPIRPVPQTAFHRSVAKFLQWEKLKKLCLALYLIVALVYLFDLYVVRGMGKRGYDFSKNSIRTQEKDCALLVHLIKDTQASGLISRDHRCLHNHLGNDTLREEVERTLGVWSSSIEHEKGLMFAVAYLTPGCELAHSSVTLKWC